MKVKYSIISEAGRRSNNEDYVRVIDKPNESRWFGTVCDGLGAHSMGLEASETVCNAVCDYWNSANDDDLVVKARRACHFASVKLDERASGMNRVQMGTTLVMAGIDGNTIIKPH